MPKDTAVINGVTLTRGQVEEALREMDKPDPPRRPLHPGRYLSPTYGEVVVVTPFVEDIIVKGGIPIYRDWLFAITREGCLMRLDPRTLTKP